MNDSGLAELEGHLDLCGLAEELSQSLVLFLDLLVALLVHDVKGFQSLCRVEKAPTTPYHLYGFLTEAHFDVKFDLALLLLDAKLQSPSLTIECPVLVVDHHLLQDIVERT